MNYMWYPEDYLDTEKDKLVLILITDGFHR